MENICQIIKYYSNIWTEIISKQNSIIANIENKLINFFNVYLDFQIYFSNDFQTKSIWLAQIING